MAFLLPMIGWFGTLAIIVGLWGLDERRAQPVVRYDVGWLLLCAGAAAHAYRASWSGDWSICVLAIVVAVVAIIHFGRIPTANDWNATEAIHAFVGHLTTNRNALELSSEAPVYAVARLMRQFVARHGLQNPREGWESLIIVDKKRAPEADWLP